MENFFDLATPDEVTSNFSSDESPLSTEEIAFERRMLTENPDINLEYLAYLFAGRGDFTRANKYVDAIQDDMRRADTSRMLTHIDGYYDAMENG